MFYTVNPAYCIGHVFCYIQSDLQLLIILVLTNGIILEAALQRCSYKNVS